MKKRLSGLLSTAIIVCVIINISAGLVMADRYTDLTDEWTKDGLDILTGFYNMYNPHIVHEPGEAYPFKMWFFGWAVEGCNPETPGCDGIFHGRSLDSYNWEIYSGPGVWDATDPNLWEAVVSAQSETYDNYHNGDPSVVKKDGVYYMAYSATGNNEGANTISCVMGASSTDGINWTKTASPILINMDDYDYDPPVINHDYGDFHRPSIMFDEGKWKCWFDYWNPAGGTSMVYAECPADSFMNPAAWVLVQAGTTAVILNWPNPDVVKVGGRYYSYSDAVGYPGPGWYSRHIVEAVSNDGLNWTINGHIPPEADVPTTHVPEAFVMDVEGQTLLLLYYACQQGNPNIGDGFCYKRIRHMWRPTYSIADLNKDFSVDLQDIAIFSENWMEGH